MSGPRHDRLCCARCWHRDVRDRLVAHLTGERFCADFDRRDFGLLRRPWHPNAPLAHEIVTRLRAGLENLTIIAWVIETGRPLDDALAILERLDINGRRLPRPPHVRRGDCRGAPDAGSGCGGAGLAPPAPPSASPAGSP